MRLINIFVPLSKFDQYIRSFVKDEQMYYIILDEIQLVDDFEYILNGLLYEKILMFT